MNPTDSNSIRFAGDVNIEYISVVTSTGLVHNIKNQVMAIEIYEDLFSPFITGVININESFDFINVLPFIGEEYINLSVFTPSFGNEDHIEGQFYIYKVSNRQILNLRTQIYQIHFISKEAIVDLNKNVSKSYQGKVSDIAKEVLTNKIDGLETEKKVNIEATSNTTKFISNYWSPVKTLNYIADTAITLDNATNYIFFENRRGLNFASLDTLYKQPSYIKFVYDNYSRDYRADGGSVIDLNKDYSRLLDIDVPNVFDYMDRTRSGMYGSKLITFDTTTKRYLVKNYDMLKDFDNNYHLNRYAAVSKKNISNPNALVINYPKAYASHNGYTDVTNASIIQKRISRLMQAETTKIQVTVMGRTDYTVGMIVELDLNKMQPIQKNEDAKDNIFSGRYIVSAINHYINRDKHECSMELIKDSYVVDFNNRS